MLVFYITQALLIYYANIGIVCKVKLNSDSDSFW